MQKKAPTVKKTYNLPPDLIDRVRKIFKARTETEAIILALKEMTFMEDVTRALRSTSGSLPHYKPLR
jgi:hypothetical protein